MPTLSADFLASIPLFQGMTEQERSQLVQVMKRESHQPDEKVIKPGDPTRGLHVVLEGEAVVVLDVHSFENPFVANGETHVMERASVAKLEIGSTFGEVSFFHGGEHTATVRATKRLELLTLPEESYKELLKVQSMAAYKLALNGAHILADRVRLADQLISELIRSQHDSLSRADWFETHMELHAGTGGEARFF